MQSSEQLFVIASMPTIPFLQQKTQFANLVDVIEAK
jgi:hypothetical protein